MIHTLLTTVVLHYDRSIFLLKECDTNHTIYFTVNCRTPSFRVRNTYYVYTFSLHHPCQKKNYLETPKAVVYNGEMALFLFGLSEVSRMEGKKKLNSRLLQSPVSIFTLSFFIFIFLLLFLLFFYFYFIYFYFYFFYFLSVRSKSFCSWKKDINGRLQEWRCPRRCGKAE